MATKKALERKAHSSRCRLAFGLLRVNRRFLARSRNRPRATPAPHASFTAPCTNGSGTKSSATAATSARFDGKRCHQRLREKPQTHGAQVCSQSRNLSSSPLPFRLKTDCVESIASRSGALLVGRAPRSSSPFSEIIGASAITRSSCHGSVTTAHSDLRPQQGGGRSHPLTNLGRPSRPDRCPCPTPSRLPGRSSKLRQSQESGGAGRRLPPGTCCPGRTGQSRAPPRNPRGKRSRQART